MFNFLLALATFYSPTFETIDAGDYEWRASYDYAGPFVTKVRVETKPNGSFTIIDDDCGIEFKGSIVNGNALFPNDPWLRYVKLDGPNRLVGYTICEGQISARIEIEKAHR